MSRFSRSRSSSRSPNRKDAERSSPNLSVSELERLLYTGKTACNHADEVWPRLYIGDQWVDTMPPRTHDRKHVEEAFTQPPLSSVRERNTGVQPRK